MSSLVNDYQRCELLDLGYGPRGHGPFVVRQEGYAPGSFDFRLDRFYLRRDGTWVINLAVFALAEEEKNGFIFTEITEVIAMFEQMMDPPKVEHRLPEDKSVEELELAARTTLEGIWARIQAARSHPRPPM